MSTIGLMTQGGRWCVWMKSRCSFFQKCARACRQSRGAKRYRDAERIVVVMDNLNTHSPASLYELLPAREAKRIADRLEVHYTPKHESWLNMAEIEFSVLGKRLSARIPSTEALQRPCTSVQKERNSTKATVNWQFTADNARIKLQRLYPSLEVR